MSRKEKEYRRLPGIHKGFIIGRYRLWEGSDHILQVFSRFGVEDYRRYYFNDIQAIVITKTDKGKIFGLILGLVSLIFGLLVMTSEGGWAVFNGIILAVLLSIFLFNWFRGPTCTTQIYTPAQTETLPSLYRLRPSLKVIDRLKALIEKTQGALPPENLPRNLPAGPSPRPSSDPSAEPAASQAGPASKPAAKESGRYHLILFILLLSFALINLAELAFTHIALTLLGSVIMMTMFIFIIIALIRQHGSDMAAALRAVTWGAAGFGGICLVGSYFLTMLNVIKNPHRMQNQWEIFKTMSSISPWDSSFLFGFNLFLWLGAALLGGAGMVLLNRHRSKKAKGADKTRASIAGKQ